VAPEHLPCHRRDQQREAEHAELQAGARHARAKAREHRCRVGRPRCVHERHGLVGLRQTAHLPVSWMRLIMSRSLASVMNLSYTGFITAWNEALSTSTICEPAAFTVARDFSSRSSHSLRCTATDS